MGLAVEWRLLVGKRAMTPLTAENSKPVVDHLVGNILHLLVKTFPIERCRMEINNNHRATRWIPRHRALRSGNVP